MNKKNLILKFASIVLISFVFVSCGKVVDEEKETPNIIKDETPAEKIPKLKEPDKYDLEYKELSFYEKVKPYEEYKLELLSDSDFNSLSEVNKLLVANKLLETLFFGYEYKILQEKIDSGVFISTLKSSLSKNESNNEKIEEILNDREKFYYTTSNSVPLETNKILSRFYVMQNLDNHFLKHWISYILTQTIMFSPAQELDSSQMPNIASVYNRIFTSLKDEEGMRYMTYIHMMSEDNWRRFRSPEDNGREMFELYLNDLDDNKVPLAARALQNWRLDRRSFTLVVGLNVNTKPIELFDTTIYSGDDFYRELVKSKEFSKGVTIRLVDFFFPNATSLKKSSITDTIVSSSPETWQDILLQIIFSKEYLLHTNRAKSAEESFFSLTKKIDYQHFRHTFNTFRGELEKMGQASMKYKLGKLDRVPLDTLSFVTYHSYIRDRVLLLSSNPLYKDDYSSWNRRGWGSSFVDNKNFTFDENDEVKSLESLINYIFLSTLSREAYQKELELFKNHMLKDGELVYAFDMFYLNEDKEREERVRLSRKTSIALVVLNYISRLDSLYLFKEVK